MKKGQKKSDRIKDLRSIKLIKKEKKNYEIYYWIGIFSFFCGILVVFKPAYDYTLIKNLTGFLFCLFLSFYFLLKGKEFDFSSYIYLPIFFFIYILISSFYAPFKFEAAKNLENYLLYFLIFLISSNLELDKKIFYIWIGIGLISAIIGISNFYGEKHYAISTFGNPNFFAGHIIMVLCLSFSNILNWQINKKEKYDKFFKFLDISCFLFGTWALIVSQSRAAIMAFIIGISSVWYIENIEKKSFIKYIPFSLLFISLFLLSPKIIVWYKTNIRYFIWRGTLRMILKKPVFGYGFGNFIFFYPYFRVREYFLQPESTPVTNHPHNEYLELWTETGIIGLLLFLIFIFSFIINAVKNKKETKILHGGIIGGIISVLSDNIFSTNLRNPSTSMYFWFLLGITFKYMKFDKIELKFSKILWYTIFSTSFILSIFHSYYRVFPQIYYKNGITAKDNGFYFDAIENYLVVCKYNPYNYENWYKLAYAYGMVGDYKKAEQIYLYINKYLFPHFAKTDANLGTVYLKIGDIEKAFKYYKDAEYFNPYDEDILCSIASIYLVYYNNQEKAVKYLNRVLKINPENIYASKTMDILKNKGKIRR
ncbi:MAG: O-antigen ligase family protein [Candidatus Omnitrophica bacterium]|nr:O-antigen ligase family protein [Candidatus Omnitrophota bacterium]MCM8802460.1 O-antigen ligase family protein [Candidatus Omnitrophota bacterium]